MTCSICGGCGFHINRDKEPMQYETCECQQDLNNCPKCGSEKLDLIRWDGYNEIIVFRCECSHQFTESIPD